MKTLHCDYFVPLKESADGDWWGAITITNHSNELAFCVLQVLDFTTGTLLKESSIDLNSFESVVISNQSPELLGITGRTRLYINCNEKVFAKAGNSRGTDNAIVWENMEALPFPKP